MNCVRSAELLSNVAAGIFVYFGGERGSWHELDNRRELVGVDEEQVRRRVEGASRPIAAAEIPRIDKGALQAGWGEYAFHPQPD